MIIISTVLFILVPYLLIIIMEEEKTCMCALASILLFRPKTSRDLIEKYGSAINVLKLPCSELLSLLGNEKLAAAIKSKEILLWAKEEVKWAVSKGVEIIAYSDEAYPKLLKECDDAPLILYYKGCANLNQKHTVSIVGTRLASGYGKGCCSKIIDHLNRYNYNPLVVSGLAYGIDIAVHKEALAAGLNTIAVLPNGMDTIYPLMHRDIAKQIIKQGGLLTEFPRGILPRKINFIKRNRIIAGISQGVIVVESRIKGGAMSTVEFANSYNRDIFALPGRLNDTNSFGCNYLISKNIAIIYNSEIIVPQTLGWAHKTTSDITLQPNLFSCNINNKEKILLSLKINLPVSVDEIVTNIGLDFDEVAFLLLELELEGKITSLGGRGYCLRK